jgi:Ca-activated chloride channel homolog
MNNPQINPDDPKWTAYVLGELDEAERLEIEHLLEISDEARALIDELNLATMTLKEELTPMGALAMTPEQKATIRAAAEPAPARWFGILPLKWGWAMAGAAAAVVLVATPIIVMRQGSQGSVPAIPQTAGNITEPVALEDKLQRQQPAEKVARNEPQQERYTEQELSKRQTPAADKASESRARTESDDRDDRNDRNDRNDGKDDVSLEKKLILETAAAPPPPPPPPMPTVAPPPPVRQSSTGVVGGVVGGQIDNPSLIGATGASLRKEIAPEFARNAEAAESSLSGPRPTPPPAAAPAAPAVAARGGGAGGGGRGAGGGAGGRAAGAGAAVGGQQGQQGQQGQLGALGQGQVNGVVRDGLSVRAATPPPPAPPAPPPAILPGGRVDNIFRIAPNTEAYDRIVDNPFIRTTEQNLATFSIDVDTASYTNVRRFLTQNQMPPRDAVRIEEMINYFNYDYEQPRGRDPIAPNMEVAAAPWNSQSRLVRIGIKARDINRDRRPPSNLVFLIDVSGSMNQPAKLPLVKAGLKMLVDQLGENDTVSIVVYAGASGLVLPPTSAVRKDRIQLSIDSLQPGGSTNGASGIRLAYEQAVLNFIKGGTNRVILMTDGDFNVGITNQGDLTRLIEDRAKSGVFLSVLGFGMGNIKDSTLEKLADQGNGNYAYIDNLNQARKVLVEEMGATLITVAKDVKIQVDFNPGRVEAYRLIGYENRVLRTEDFNNDAKDAGDMGAGHTVTALFEIVPKGGTIPGPSIDPSKYTGAPAAAAATADRANASTSNEMLTLRVRYKQPDSDTSSRMDVPLVDQNRTFARASSDFRFATAVAEFGMILRDSPYRGNGSIESVLDIAESSRGQDRNGYRREFIDLVQRARRLR